jgi:hypothetical protein
MRGNDFASVTAIFGLDFEGKKIMYLTEIL